MKIAAMLIGFLFAISASARPETSGHRLLRSIKELAQKCITEPKDSSEPSFLGFQNHCEEIQILSSTKASIKVGGQTVTVVLIESQDADGGDLNHLLVYDASGKLIAQRLNVIAFDNIFRGLLGNPYLQDEILEELK